MEFWIAREPYPETNDQTYSLMLFRDEPSLREFEGCRSWWVAGCMPIPHDHFPDLVPGEKRRMWLGPASKPFDVTFAGTAIGRIHQLPERLPNNGRD